MFVGVGGALVWVDGGCNRPASSSLRNAAGMLAMDPDVIKLYEGLFFKVRNREATYALSAIFPQTRLGAVVEAEKDYNEVDLTLMRAGRDHGWKEVARLAGLNTLEDAEESPETMLAETERTMAANARMLARAGHLNRKDSPGIRHGKTLIIRAQKQTAVPLTEDDKVGLGSFGMKAAVREHFRRISDPEIDYRLALQRQERLREEAEKVNKQQ